MGAIIGDFYRAFFIYSCPDGRINKTEIRLNPVSGSVEILATFQYPGFVE